MNLEELQTKAERFIEKHFDARLTNATYDDEIDYCYYEGKYKTEDAFINSIKKEHRIKVVITIVIDKRDDGNIWIELIPFINDIEKKMFNFKNKYEDLHYFRLEPNEDNEFSLNDLELDSY